MKKIFALALAAAMSLSVLVGCGSKEAEGTNKEVDLNETYAAIEEAMIEKLGGEENAPMLDTIEGELLDNLYPGLNDLGLKQCVVKAPAITAVVAEFALAEAADADQAKQVAEIFQARIDAQAEGGAWYPETVEGWKNDATVVTNGNYVMLVAMENNADYIEIFNAQFN